MPSFIVVIWASQDYPGNRTKQDSVCKGLSGTDGLGFLKYCSSRRANLNINIINLSYSIIAHLGFLMSLITFKARP